MRSAYSRADLLKTLRGAGGMQITKNYRVAVRHVQWKCRKKTIRVETLGRMKNRLHTLLYIV